MSFYNSDLASRIAVGFEGFDFVSKHNFTSKMDNFLSATNDLAPCLGGIIGDGFIEFEKSKSLRTGNVYAITTISQKLQSYYERKDHTDKQDAKIHILEFIEQNLQDIGPEHTDILENIKSKHFRWWNKFNKSQLSMAAEAEINYYIRVSKKEIPKLSYLQYLLENYNFDILSNYYFLHSKKIINERINEALLMNIAKLSLEYGFTKCTKTIKNIFHSGNSIDQEKVIEFVKLFIKKFEHYFIKCFPMFKIQEEEKRFELAWLFLENLKDHKGQYVEQFITNLEIFEIFDAEKRFALAKLCAQKSGEKTAKQIQKFGFNDENKLLEIAKLCMVDYHEDPIQYVDNFHIDDESKRLELVRHFFKQSINSTVKHFKKFGITDEKTKLEFVSLSLQDLHFRTYSIQNIVNFEIKDQSKLFELIKRCAEQNRNFFVTECIDTFGITDEEKCFELAKICASRNPEKTAEFIQRFFIKDEDKRFEIAKLCASRSEKIAQHIQNFGLTSENYRYEIARICAINDSESTAENIQLFGIINESSRIEIAKLCAEKCKNFAEHIHRFGITDEAILIDFAWLCARHEGDKAAQNFQAFAIRDERLRFEIAKICARNYEGVAKHTYCFGITDEANLIELAMICADKDSSGTAENIELFGISDEPTRYKIAQTCMFKCPATTALNFAKFHITNEEKINEVISFYEENISYRPRNLVKNIQNFGLKCQNKLYSIAKLNASILPEYIHNFGIQDVNIRYELAELCVSIDVIKTLKNIKNFQLEEDQLLEIAKLCLKKNFIESLNNLYNFRFSESYILKIGKYCAQQDAVTTASKLYYIQSREHRFEIAKICMQLNPKETSKYISFLNLDIKELKFLFILGLMVTPDILFNLHNFNLNPDDKRQIGELACMDRLSIWPEEQVIDIIQKLNHSHLNDFFTPVINSLSDVKNPIARKHLCLWIAATSILVKERLSESEVQWLMEKELFQAVAALQIPYLRHPSRNVLIKLASSPTAKSLYEKLLLLLTDKLPKSYKWRILLPALVSVIAGEDKDLAEKILADFNSSVLTFKDFKKFGLLIKVLSHFITENTLEEHNRIKFVRQLFSYKGKEILEQCYAISSIFDFGQGALLNDWQGTFTECAEKIIQEKIKCGQVEDLSQKYMKTFGASRQPQALMLYASKMSSLNDPLVMDCFSSFVESVLNAKFQDTRYSLVKNPHLATLFGDGKNQEIFDKWKKGSSENISKYSDAANQEKKIPADFAWLKQKIIEDKHLTLDKLPYLKMYLEEPHRLEEIRIKLLKIGGEHHQPTIRFQSLCLELAVSESNQAKLKILEEISGLLTVKEFARPEFLNDVKGLISESKKATKQDAVVVDTDDPIDILLCGTEVNGSCQRVDGDPINNKGLLGYLMDGKNRLLAVKDHEGMILARSIIRLLWDGEKPVLFLERFYPSGIDDSYKKALIGLALKKANELGVPLTFSTSEYGEQYPRALQALGGPAPFEYSDAVQGLQIDGKYTINASFYIA